MSVSPFAGQHVINLLSKSYPKNFSRLINLFNSIESKSKELDIMLKLRNIQSNLCRNDIDIINYQHGEAIFTTLHNKIRIVQWVSKKLMSTKALSKTVKSLPFSKMYTELMPSFAEVIGSGFSYVVIFHIQEDETISFNFDHCAYHSWCSYLTFIGFSYMTSFNKTINLIDFKSARLISFNSSVTLHFQDDCLWNDIDCPIPYSVLPSESQPQLTVDGLVNCSVPNYHLFEAMYHCDLRLDCERGQDEAHCPYRSQVLCLRCDFHVEQTYNQDLSHDFFPVLFKL